MSEKEWIESTTALVQFRPDYQAGSRGPEDIKIAIELPGIFFDPVEDPPPAKWVSEFIYKASRSPCMFK
jgi:hypothetical protein